MALFPSLGIMKSSAATMQYGNHLIFLFMGGFFLAVAMERWNLHKRVALYTIKLVGTSPARIILGFMLATAFLSMWVSNTATAMMMVPIGLAVIKSATGCTPSDFMNNPPELRDKLNFGRALMLSVAYAASIGGVGTIIGTPPNVVMVGMVEKLYGQQISFLDWMIFAVPLVVVFLAITWFMLTKVLFNPGKAKLGGSKELISNQLEDLGPITKEERWIITVFGIVASLWIARGFVTKLPGAEDIIELKYIHDSTIAIFGSILLFIIPSNLKKGRFILDWKTAVKIPWNVILLFGGGLALAKGFQGSGLALWIAEQLRALEGSSILIFIFCVVVIVIFLTEITSNTATATLLVPIMGGAAIAMSIHPYGAIIGACLASSAAFMLPVATPPNAVVFGSECISIKDMAKAGIWMNIIGAVLITLFVMYLLPLIWGIDLKSVPGWAM
ncbi:MAG: DASS family sodium-coupled anion symporter [Planctomycetota bacterium]|nr:DASS family sodium-coupled anion symporter [Planctomycetota bacterium]